MGMEIPYTQKSEILVRGLMRFTAPWLFGRFTVDSDAITLKYFFKTKRLPLTQITGVKVFDNVLQFSSGKTTYQVRSAKADAIHEHIETSK